MKNLLIIILLINSVVFTQSINENYKVEEKINGGSESVGVFNTVEYSVADKNGSILYKITNQTDYDIPYSHLYAFENGGSVLISSFYGMLTFYNSSGTKITDKMIKENVIGEYERSIKAVVDNNSLIIQFGELNDNFSTIQKYGFNGRLVSSIKIELTNINGLAYSEKLGQIYLSHVEWNNDGSADKKVSLFNEIGQVQKQYDAFFDKGFFTGDNRFVAFSNKTLLTVNTESLEVIFKNKANDNEMFLDITVSKEKIVAVSARPPKLQNGKWYYEDPTILKLDNSGKIIKENKIETDLFSDYEFTT
ncbi:MAG: hypothetical protein ABFS12_05290, partial [Bacteroidota bacterium]